jgi:Carboxypeptidase regulatory-like domain
MLLACLKCQEEFMSRSKGMGVSFAGHFFSLLLLMLWVALCPVANAQSTAVLRGSVIDPSGAAIAHAKVAVRNQGTGVEWNNESDSDGLFAVPALPPGKYAITVSAEGFQTAVISNLVLDVSTTVTQTIQLKVGKVSQEVTITAETPVIDDSTVTIGQVVDQKTVRSRSHLTTFHRTTT